MAHLLAWSDVEAEPLEYLRSRAGRVREPGQQRTGRHSVARHAYGSHILSESEHTQSRYRTHTQMYTNIDVTGEHNTVYRHAMTDFFPEHELIAGA